MLAFVRGEHDCLVATTIIESGPRHPHRQHPDRRARRPARPRPGVPDPRPGRPQPRARLRLPALPLGRGAHRRRGGAPRHPLGQHRARLGLPGRDARPRDPRRRQPARRRAVRSRRRGRLRALLPDARGRGRGAAGGRGRAPAEPSASRSGWTLDVDAYVPADYVPFEAAKIDVHRASRPPASRGELRALREELEDRFGPVPEPVANLLELQRARIELGEAGARTRRVPRGAPARLARRARLRAGRRRCARGLEEAIYEWRERTLALPVPDEPGAPRRPAGRGGCLGGRQGRPGRRLNRALAPT